MLNKRTILSAASYLLSPKTPWRLALILTSILFAIIVVATFVRPPQVNSQGAGPIVEQLIGPPHNTWINYNPTFTAEVSSLGGGVGNTYVGGYNSIDVKDNLPRIAYSYQDDVTDDVLFLRCTDSDCTSPVIKNPIETGVEESDYPRLILDNAGLAMISYSVKIDGTTGSVRFAHCSDINCDSQPVSTIIAASVPADTGVMYPTIAKGSDGRARIAYYNNSSGEVTLVKCDGPDLDCTNTTENIAYSFSGQKPVDAMLSMELNTADLPRIAIQTKEKGLIYIYCSTVDCSSASSKTIHNKASDYLGPSMALNYDGCPEGCPAIAYRLGAVGQSGPKDLYFASCATSTCSSSSVNPLLDQYNGYRPYVKIHPSTSKPRVIFKNYIPAALYYVRCTNNDCTTNDPSPPEMITNFNGGINQAYKSLVLDSSGNGMISVSELRFVSGQPNGRLRYYHCNDDACSNPTETIFDNIGIVSGSGPDVWAYFNWAQVAENPLPPIGTDGSVVSAGGPGNSTYTSSNLDDGIFDWRAKAIDTTGAESAFTPGFWRVKKDTLDPTVTCSVSSSSTNIIVTYDTLDRIPTPTATPSGPASGNLQREINGDGNWSTVSSDATGSFNETGVLGDTYAYRFKATDNAGNISDGDTYSSCGSTLLSEPGWIKTTNGDVGAKKSINMTIAPPTGSNADYLVILDGAKTNFTSAKDWLVEIYSGGIDTGFTSGSEFGELWDEFGKGRAGDWLYPDKDGEIPNTAGVYAFPSVADIGSTAPPGFQDFTYGGSAINGTGEVVLFINGNLNINSNLDLGNKKVVFIVRGDVNVSPTVLNVGGFYVTSGVFNSGTNIVPPPSVESRVGAFSSTAIGSDDLPVISHWDQTNGDLKVAKCGNAACSAGNTLTVVDSVGNVGKYTSIAFGSDDLPVISYSDSTNRDLKVAKCGNAACSASNTLTVVDSASQSISYTSITIGTDGFPVISYTASFGTYYDLKVAKCGNAACSAGNTLTVVDSGGFVGLSTSITIAPDGLPVISYYDNTNGDLKVAKCGNAACSASNTLTVVDSVGTRSYYLSSIKISTGGLPVISYYDDTNTDLKVAKCGNAACSAGNTLTVVDSAWAGEYSSLVLGTDGLPVISYWNNNWGLSVVKCGNAACSAGNTFAQGIGAAWPAIDTSIALGTDGFPIISYYDMTNGDLKVAKQVSGTGTGCGDSNWTCVIVDGHGEDGDCPECKLTVNGAVLAFGGFSLGRDLGLSNATAPTEIFNYDSSYLYLFAKIDPSLNYSLLGEQKGTYKELSP